MVEVQINRTDDIFNIKLSGHALYNPGNDIVCAAISSLVFAFAGTLKNKEYIHRFDTMEEYSIIDVVSMDQYLEAITDQLIIGLLQIEKKYSKNLSIKLIDSL